jgi:hypothetical protein
MGRHLRKFHRAFLEKAGFRGPAARCGWQPAEPGSGMEPTSDIGKVTETCACEAFGTGYSGEFRHGNLFGYNGKRLDPPAGLYDYGFWDYLPELVLWMI